MKVPFFTTMHQDACYGRELRAAISAVIESGSFILGEQVKLFEKRLAAYCGVKHAIGVANGSDALFLATKALNLPKGSEVITTPYTFFASAAGIIRNGLKPVFVDVDPSTYHIDVGALERKVTKNTKALLTIDLFSHTADNGRINEIAGAHNLAFLEDSAEAFGMKWGGAHAGSTAKAGVLSFFPTKTLGCFGDGGAIITNDDAIAAECQISRVHGAAKKYFHSMIGINSRLDELQAAVLNVKLDYVDREIAERAAIVAKYREGLSGLAQVVLPHVPPQATPVWYVFAPTFEKRDALAAALAEKGIGTSVYWPKPLHLQECFADLGYRPGDFPVAESLCANTLALPIFVGMSDAEISFVCEMVKSFYKSTL